MGLQSLRDKLLQAGVVTEEQAKKSEEDAKRRPPPKQARPQQGRGGRPNDRRPAPPPRELTPEEKLAAEEAAAYKERQRLLDREREENRKRAAEDRKRQESLRALCERHGIEARGDEAFHFASRKNRILRVYLTAEQVKGLDAGELAIVEKPLPDRIDYALVPRAAAEEALGIDKKAVRFYAKGPGETYGFQGDQAAAAAKAAEQAASDAQKAEAAPAADAGQPAATESDPQES